MIVLSQNTTQLLESRYLNNLVAYLKLSGWRVAEETSTWYEFLGEQDINGQPLQVILPRNPDTLDTPSYIEKAIELLSALSDESVNITAQRVQYYFSDIFVISNLETGIYQSISLKLAATQITKVKSLVMYGARTERHPQPYFHKPSSAGENMLNLFRFGHTVHGSFGLTVEAPIVHSLELFTKESSQLPLLPNLSDYVVEAQIEIPPIERRIMERIIRGLLITDRATVGHDIDPIVKEYGSGFSGNMCNAIIDIAQDGDPIEYRVLWSPKVPVSEDVSSVTSVKLNETSYTLLREAIQEMKRLEPQFEVVRGIVTHVGSTVAPLGDASDGRTVVLRRIFDDDRRSHSIIVPLDKDQYLEAHKAHLDWSTIEITGIVERVGSNYRLVDGRDFRVVNPLK